MLFFELRFPVLGTLIPSDHGYPLFSSLSRHVPAIHHTNEIFFDTLAGRVQKDHRTWINPDTKLKIRATQAHLSSLLALTYQELPLVQYSIRLGVPEIVPIEPASNLYARTVTIKNHQHSETFLAAVQQKLNALEISTTPVVGRRRVMCIGGHKVVGFSLWLQHVGNEASLFLIRHGIGGRRHIGCGFFHAIHRFQAEKRWQADRPKTSSPIG
ncbi:MAG: type I-MYXAN CRISPR-associated protein Cas6/Cmx6 [Acidobacteria bacterium]|nr:type I-MYXAN CRISPR-associated protein Cas6/Cmx6 [Acidobacteriota bacterium]